MSLINMISAFHFLRPWWLIGIIVFSALYYLQRQKQDLATCWQNDISSHLLRHMIVKSKQTSWFNPVNMLFITGIVLCIALAGPSWKKTYSPLSQDKSALVIAIDVSKTMEQGDLSPTRLQRSKQKISDILSLRGDAFTAVVAYAGTAHTVIPLSNDKDIIKHFLDSISQDIMPVTGKSPQAILPEIDRLLAQEVDPASILLLTDGVESGSFDAFKRYFSQHSHQLLVLGMGKTQQQIDEMALPLFGNSFTPLQEGLLQALAETSNGKYQQNTADKQDVHWLNEQIESHFLQSGDDERPWLDSGYPLVFVLMALFLNWFRKGWSLQW